MSIGQPAVATDPNPALAVRRHRPRRPAGGPAAEQPAVRAEDLDLGVAGGVEVAVAAEGQAAEAQALTVDGQRDGDRGFDPNVSGIIGGRIERC